MRYETRHRTPNPDVYIPAFFRSACRPPPPFFSSDDALCRDLQHQASLQPQLIFSHILPNTSTSISIAPTHTAPFLPNPIVTHDRLNTPAYLPAYPQAYLPVRPLISPSHSFS